MTDTSSLTLKPCVMVRVLQRSPVREIRTPGSARGLSGNRQFYLNKIDSAEDSRGPSGTAVGPANRHI